MIQEQWFQTPIWYSDLEVNFSEELKEIKKLRQAYANTKRTLRNGDQTENLRTIENQVLQKLFLFVEQQANSEIANLKKSSEARLKMLNVWINFGNPGSYNIIHNHPHSIFSAVLYLDVPQDSGDIVFYRDDRMIDYWPSGLFIDIPTAAVYKPRNNLLLLFPSWIEHEVTQNNSNNQRISLSCNFDLEFI